LIFLRLRSARLLSSKIDISFYNWKIMHINNAYLRCFQSNFLCSSIHILCCSSYIEKLYRLSDNLSIRFASDFRFKAFNYKQISALSSIALLRCIIMNIIERVEWTVLHMMKSMQIVERSRRLLYLYTANVTESRRVIFLLTLVYEELLETSLSSHFSTLSLDACKFLSFHCFSVSVVQWISWSSVEIVTWSIRLLSYLD